MIMLRRSLCLVGLGSATLAGQLPQAAPLDALYATTEVIRAFVSQPSSDSPLAGKFSARSSLSPYLREHSSRWFVRPSYVRLFSPERQMSRLAEFTGSLPVIRA